MDRLESLNINPWSAPGLMPGVLGGLMALFGLALAFRAGNAAPDVQKGIEKLMKQQNKDGGWSQDVNLASDAFATGQALYFLRLAGVKYEHDAIRRGVAFLVASQRADGSWPMTARGQPGEKPASNAVPITYFGSAWAVLGLVRSVGKD